MSKIEFVESSTTNSLGSKESGVSYQNKDKLKVFNSINSVLNFMKSNDFYFKTKQQKNEKQAMLNNKKRTLSKQVGRKKGSTTALTKKIIPRQNKSFRHLKKKRNGIKTGKKLEKSQSKKILTKNFRSVSRGNRRIGSVVSRDRSQKAKLPAHLRFHPTFHGKTGKNEVKGKNSEKSKKNLKNILFSRRKKCGENENKRYPIDMLSRSNSRNRNIHQLMRRKILERQSERNIMRRQKMNSFAPCPCPRPVQHSFGGQPGLRIF